MVARLVDGTDFRIIGSESVDAATWPRGARVGARVRLCALEYNTSMDLNVRRNVARRET